MSKTPKISVILPVYNCELYIKETIDSVLEQTFSDFELLVIDDCSTDNTVSVIKEFLDERICLIEKEKNSGLINSLNFGISIAKGEYIARMDGDDICLPERFAKQVAFLDKNPAIIMCGTAIKFIGSSCGNLFYPQTNEEVKICLFSFSPTFAHPTVMGKKIFFKNNNYDIAYEHAEDYELWTRLVQEGEAANLNEILLEYRVHPNQVSVTKKNIQDLNSYKSRLKMLQSLQLDSKYSEDDIIKFLVNKNWPYTITECSDINKFYNFVIHQNTVLHVFERNLFKSKLQQIKMSLYKQYFNRKRILHPKSLSFLLRKITIRELLILLKMKCNA
jgi:glycosyltransferase involved in cell wall biosynthesis